MPLPCVGLDVGGANLKISHADGAARSVPFALWREPAALRARLDDLFGAMPPFARIALTMTGELCDCYATKREGVSHIVETVVAAAGGCDVVVWALPGTLVSPTEAVAAPARCAAGNWHALATWVGGLHPTEHVLLLDVGSTTTDIIPVDAGRVGPCGATDTERLQVGSLVYLGAARTPVMALGPDVAWRGSRYPLMAEQFAAMQDVFVLTGHRAAAPACRDTCDGQPLSVEGAARRVLRMIGAELDAFRIGDARSLAASLAERWMQRVAEPLRRLVDRHACRHVVISGSGDALGGVAAGRACPHLPLHRLSDRIGRAGTDAATAWALACLGGATAMRCCDEVISAAR